MSSAVFEMPAADRQTNKKSRKKGSSQKALSKMIYYFGQSKCEGNVSQKQLLGGKGANLAEMTSIGLPVPPGFTITTKVCDLYYQSGRKLPASLMQAVRQNVAILESELGKKFGNTEMPLLLSVRTGNFKVEQFVKYFNVLFKPRSKIVCFVSPYFSDWYFF